MENNKNISQHPSHYQEDEIDLIALAKTLWEGRKTIIKTTIIFACIGLFVALTTPAQYTSTVVVKPILSDSKANIGGSLGGLAAMAGINLGGAGASAEIHPTLYPKIVESYKFQKELMQTSIYVEELGEEVSFEEFYTKIYKPGLLQIIKRYTFGLPGLILRAIKSEKTPLGNDNLNFDRRTGSDEILLKLLINQFNLSVDEKDGFVSLSATMPESIMAAQLVSSAQKLLQKFVIRYKLKKAEEDLRFIEERYGEKKNEFEIAQRNLAKYRDANKNVNTATALTEIERLESEYQLAFSVYSELAKQVEKQKIQVKENTPVFVVLQDAVIIEENSGISKKLLLILWVGFGLLFSSVWVGLSNFRSRLNEVVS